MFHPTATDETDARRYGILSSWTVAGVRYIQRQQSAWKDWNAEDVASHANTSFRSLSFAYDRITEAEAK